MINNLRRNLNTNMQGLDKYNQQMATQKKINIPSDNPAGLVKSMRLRTNLTENEQYLNNIGESINFMDTTDSALDNITQILHRTRELTEKAANGTNDSSSHKAIAAEIRELSKQLHMIANTTYGSKHIFGGSNVTEAPSQEDKWLGNAQKLEMEIGVNVKMAINLEMKDFFVGTKPYLEDVHFMDNAIINGLTTDNLQAGDYAIKTTKLAAGASDANLSLAESYNQGEAEGIFGSATIGDISNAADLDKNASIELTVAGINSATGEITYSYEAHEYDRDTAAYTKETGTFTLKYDGTEKNQKIQIGSMEVEIKDLDTQSLDEFNLGDKGVLNLSAATAGGQYEQLGIYQGYSSEPGESPVTGGIVQNFVFNTGQLDKKTSDIKFVTLDDKGQSFDSTISMQFNSFNDADPAVYLKTRPGLFNLMEDIAADIEAGDSEAISGRLDDLDDKTDELLYKRSTIGARVNRLELQQSRLQSTKVSFTGLLSQNEDVDMAELIMNLKMQENVYRASLSVGARIIQPSLVDFLR